MISAAPIRRYATIDSTNLEAHRLAQAGERGPLWVVAEEQTGGKGRLGRNWHSPKGNLYSTLLLPVEVQLAAVPQIGFAVALAVHDVACRHVPVGRVALKWPNDCLVDGAKVAGILCETVTSNPPTLAIGCGINIASAPQGLAYPTARLTGADVDTVFAEYRTALEQRLGQWQWGRGFAAITAEWCQRAIGIGEIITITDAANSHSGFFAGLADDGALLIELATGPQRFYAGDVTIPSLQKLRTSHT